MKTYNDPVKQKAREKFREFISRNANKPMKDIRVVCFPGEEALEVKEIYDPLGIPRQNVLGLEYNPESADKLKKSDLGIEVIVQDAHDFFKNTERKFDIISLDYTGQRTWKETDITRYIAGKCLFDKFGIYCTNHLIKRESKEMKENLLNLGLGNELKQNLITSDFYKLNDQERIDYMNNFRVRYNSLMNNLEEIDLNKIRDSITIDNMLSITSGTLEIDPSNHIFKNLKLEIIASTGDGKIIPVTKELKVRGLEEIKNYGPEKNNLLIIKGDLANQLAEKTGWSKKEAYALISIQSIYYLKGKAINNLERYTYNSNKNGKMLFDMISLRPFKYGIIQSAKEIINIEDSKIKVNPNNYTHEKLRKKIEKITPLIWDEIQNILPNPVYLGSSWVPPERKEHISRNDAIGLLKSGCSPAEIEQCYSGFNIMQLAAFKAHYVTMGKNLN